MRRPAVTLAPRRVDRIPRRGTPICRGRDGRARIGRVRVAAALAGLAVAVAACSGGSSGRSGTGAPAPLTDDQAARLSQVLSKNYEAKGATFTAAAPVQPGMTLHLSGEIDWANHLGHAAVRWEGNPAPGRVIEVFWSQREVLERLPGLETALTKAGLAKPGEVAASWTARPVSTADYALDRVLELVTKLAAQQRDNPALLQQHPGTGFLRDDTLRNAAVEVFAYSDQIRHWVGVDDGRLRRVEASIGGFPQATVVDLLTLAPQTVLGPKTTEVVALETARSVYEGLNPPPR